MITLPESIEAERTKSDTFPVLLAEIDVRQSDGTYVTYYVSNLGGDTYAGLRGYNFGGHFYRQAITGQPTIKQSKDDSIDNVSITLDNVLNERPWSAVFNSVSINDWIQSKIRLYRTFRGLIDRVQIYEGYLEIPNEIGNTFRLESKSVLNGIGFSFPSLCYSKTCNWISEFAEGERCNYSGGSTACTGTWADCLAKEMTHRFGGLHVTPETGSYSYKEQRRFWFDKRRSGTYESELNTGIYGAVIPVSYGKLRIEADIITQTDMGDVNKFFGLMGHGPMGAIINAPDFNRDDISADDRKWNSSYPAIVLNNQLLRDYANYWGNDGVTGQVTPLNYTGQQGLDYLWCNEPGSYPIGGEYEFDDTRGQTFSRLAYIAGGWKSSQAKEADSIDTLEVYRYGRMIDVYENSDTTPDTLADFATGYHDNPAWVWLDILMNRTYGCRLPLSLFDIPKIRAAAAICRTEGFAIAHQFREQMGAIEAISLIQNACRGYTGYSNGKHYLVVQDAATMTAKKAAGACYTFSPSSIVRESGVYMAGGTDKKANQIEIPYMDYDQDYQTVPRILTDDENIRAAGKKESSKIKTVGVVGFDHANKLCYYYLNKARLMRREDGCKRVRGGIATMHLQVGDIVKLDMEYLDLADPDDNPSVYDGMYEIASVEWDGDEAEYVLELADPSIFDTAGVAPTVELEPSRSRNRWPYNIVAADTDLYEHLAVDVSWMDAWWTIPDPPDYVTPLPLWIHLYWKKATESMAYLQYCGKIEASKGYGRFLLPAEMWDCDCDFIFQPESKYGITRPLSLRLGASFAPLTSAVTSTAASWPVSTASLGLVAGDYVICKDEICKVDSVSANAIALTATDGVRNQYEETSPSIHLAGDSVGEALSPCLVVRKKVRDLDLTLWQHTGWTDNPFTVVAQGTQFIARWRNPHYWLAGREESEAVFIPDNCIKNWHLAYSARKDFDADDTDATDIVWVEDIPGGLHEKAGPDPGKTYYWAMRPEFYDGSTKPWVYLWDTTITTSVPNEYDRRLAVTTSRTDTSIEAPPPVTDFSIAVAKQVVDGSGATKAYLSVNFTPPDATADPDGTWRSLVLWQSRLVGAGEIIAGETGAGDPYGDWKEIANLTEPATIIIDTDPQASILAAVSKGIASNLEVTGAVDAEEEGSLIYQRARLEIPALSFLGKVRTFTVWALNDTFYATWDYPLGHTADTLDSFEIAYSTERGFNADVAFMVTYARPLPPNSLQEQGTDPNKTYFWAIRAKTKDGIYSEWTYFGTTGCDTNASLRTPITSHYSTGQIINYGDRLESTNYSAGVSGLQINADGTAEFNSVTVRGEIHAASGTIDGLLGISGSSDGSIIVGDVTQATANVTINKAGISGWKGSPTNTDNLCFALATMTGDWTIGTAVYSIAAGDVWARRGYIGGGSTTPDVIEIDTDGLQSSNYVTGTSGFKIGVDGTAEFMEVSVKGTINIGADSLISGQLFAGDRTGVHTQFDENGIFGWADNDTGNGGTPDNLNFGFANVNFGSFTINGETVTINAGDFWARSGYLLGVRIGNNGLVVGSTSGGHVSISKDGICGWKGAESTGDNISFASFTVGGSFTIGGHTYTAAAGDFWARRGFIGGDSSGNAIELSPTYIRTGNFVSGTSGFCLYTNGDAEFDSVLIRTDGENGSTGGTIYAGYMGDGTDYVTGWYGVFITGKGIVGRRDSTGATNPAVFLLGANTSAADTIHPAWYSGDFCVATNVKTAFEDEANCTAFFKFRPNAVSDQISMKGKVEMTGDCTIVGSLTAYGSTWSTAGKIIGGSVSGYHTIINFGGLTGWSGDNTVLSNLQFGFGTIAYGEVVCGTNLIDFQQGYFFAKGGYIGSVYFDGSSIKSLGYSASTWSSGTTYKKYQYCKNATGTYFKSKQDNNLNHTPSGVSDSWWEIANQGFSIGADGAISCSYLDVRSSKGGITATKTAVGGMFLMYAGVPDDSTEPTDATFQVGDDGDALFNYKGVAATKTTWAKIYGEDDVVALRLYTSENDEVAGFYCLESAGNSVGNLSLLDITTSTGAQNYMNSISPNGITTTNTSGVRFAVDITSTCYVDIYNEYRVNGTKVIGAQGAAVANATDASTVITQLNALLSRLRTHGLIAT